MTRVCKRFKFKPIFQIVEFMILTPYLDHFCLHIFLPQSTLKIHLHFFNFINTSNVWQIVIETYACDDSKKEQIKKSWYLNCIKLYVPTIYNYLELEHTALHQHTVLEKQKTSFWVADFVFLHFSFTNIECKHVSCWLGDYNLNVLYTSFWELLIYTIGRDS